MATVTTQEAVALLQAAVEAYDEALQEERARLFGSAAAGRPSISDHPGRFIELRSASGSNRLKVLQLDWNRYRVDAGGKRAETIVEPRGASERRLNWWGRWFDTSVNREGTYLVVTVEGTPHPFGTDASGLVVAPAPAVVIATHVKPGDQVGQGDPLLVLEAMKMEMMVAAPIAGAVREIVPPNTQVAPGALLVRLSPSAGEPVEPEGAPALEFPPQEENEDLGEPTRLYRRAVEQMRRLALGFDVEPNEAKALASTYGEACRGTAPDNPELLGGEDEVLGIFADICSLSGRRLSPAEHDGDDDAEIAHATEEHFFDYLRTLDAGRDSLPATFVDDLRRALAHYGVTTTQRTPDLEAAVFRIFRAQHRLDEQVGSVLAVLDRRLEHMAEVAPTMGDEGRARLDRLVSAAERRFPAIADLARELRYRAYDQPLVESARQRVYREVERHLEALTRGEPQERAGHIAALVECPQPLKGLVISRLRSAGPALREALLETLARRYYRIRDVGDLRALEIADGAVFTAEYDHEGARVHLIATSGDVEGIKEALRRGSSLLGGIHLEHDVVIDLYLWRSGPPTDPDTTAHELEADLDAAGFPRPIRRIAIAMSGPGEGLGAATTDHFTFRPSREGYREEKLYRGLHPMMGKRLDLWRLSNFDIWRLPSVEDVYLFHCVAKENPKDERLFALAEVRDLTPVRDEEGLLVGLPDLERMLTETLAGMRVYQSHRPGGKRLQWNRVLLYVRPPVELSADELYGVVQKLAPMTDGLGLEKVVVRGRLLDRATAEVRDTVLHISNPAGRGLVLRFGDPADRPIRPLSAYGQKIVQMRQRGLVYPYEIVRMITPGKGTKADFPPGSFAENDLGDEGRLIPVDRLYGENTANIVVGVIENFTAAYPEGMRRVALLGDPSRALGALAEPECHRIVAALDLAERLGVPLEWYAISAGAKIAMDSGTENMDWVGRVLRRLIEFTQSGGEVNVIVCGINVGAQPYWNAEATMLMHTKGILIMTPESAMVLTGKLALDYSGGVSAEDNFGIGGYDRVMGPNGQAQYWAPDLHEACHILLRHYDHTYVAPGERFPRRVATDDPLDRDIRTYPHRDDGSGFRVVGDIFSEATNPGRKKPFDIRSVMRAVSDQDHRPLERWPGMSDAEVAVVWDAHLGGFPVELIGLESRPLPRRGSVAADGPEHWTGGTLFPLSSKKVARAINAASGNRPVVVLANLSGFDGSPESMRRLQLEYGAEIGRAVTNFNGPIVFCVVSRYHGGAFVVFSATLNDQIEVASVEGSFASVIGGAPAAAVVFTRDVDVRTKADPRVKAVQEAMEAAEGTEKARLRARLEATTQIARSEALGAVAAEFDHVHTIYRAQQMGSVHRIISAAELRPYLIDAVDRGIARELERFGEEPPINVDRARAREPSVGRPRSGRSP